MLYWALVFFIVAVIAGILGFGGIAFAAVGIAKILFFLFLVVFLVTLVMGFAGRQPAAALKASRPRRSPAALIGGQHARQLA